MADYTDEVTDCARGVVFVIDYLDVDRDLLGEHISLDETLADCGCDEEKCLTLETWVNKRLYQAGKPVLEDGTIKPGTKIRKVIEHVC